MKTITKTNREEQDIVRGVVPPVHPGALLRDVVEDLEPKPTQHQVAAMLGVSRGTVALLLAEQRSVTPEMAFRLERAFGSTAEVWMGLQTAYDMWQVKNNKIKWREIERICSVMVNADGQLQKLFSDGDKALAEARSIVSKSSVDLLSAHDQISKSRKAVEAKVARIGPAIAAGLPKTSPSDRKAAAAVAAMIDGKSALTSAQAKAIKTIGTQIKKK